MDKKKLVINGKEYLISELPFLIKIFCVLDNSYLEYDSKKINEKNWIEDCISFANKGMRARISEKKEKKYIISKKLEIKKSIKTLEIFKNTRLEKTNDKAIQNLKELFKYIEGIGIKNAKATKILHKKFPNLIPIVDSIVAKKGYGEKNENIDNLINIIIKIKKDIDKNKALLDRIRLELAKSSIKLTNLRIFDILVWMKGKDIQKIVFKNLGS